MTETGIPAWLNLLLRLWPILLVLAGLIGRAIDQRFKKMVTDAVKASEDKWAAALSSSEEDAEFKWRERLQGPIGEIGNDALKALRMTEDHKDRIHDLETKIAPVWRMIERRIDASLRQGKTDEDDP